MQYLKLMSSNCGTARTATLADDGEITFADGSKSTDHVNLGFSATTVFVAMWMHKDAFKRYAPTQTQASMFNDTIISLGAKKPTAATAHIFHKLMGKRSVVMLDGTEHYFYKVGSVADVGETITSRPTGNVYANRYKYIDASKYGLVEYIQYTPRRRIAHFIDGSAWDIICSDEDFDLLCRLKWSDSYRGTVATWMSTNYFNIEFFKDLDERNKQRELNIFNYDASPIFCDDAPEPSSFTRGVLYGVCAVAFMLFMSSAYLFNQCFGAY